LAVLAPEAVSPHSAIDVTIRGAVELLLRLEDESWQEVAHRDLAAGTRQVRFDALSSGVYQLRGRGNQTSEQFAMKIGLGHGDERRTTIAIEPREIAGRITLGGVNLGAGTLLLRHKELRWEAASRCRPTPAPPNNTFAPPPTRRGASTSSA
jgi:hypothetical protein